MNLATLTDAELDAAETELDAEADDLSTNDTDFDVLARLEAIADEVEAIRAERVAREAAATQLIGARTFRGSTDQANDKRPGVDRHAHPTPLAAIAAQTGLLVALTTKLARVDSDADPPARIRRTGR